MLVSVCFHESHSVTGPVQKTPHGPHNCFSDQIQSHSMAPPTPKLSALVCSNKFVLISEGALHLLQAQRKHVSFYCPLCSAEKVATKIENMCHTAFQHICHFQWKYPISALTLNRSPEDAEQLSKMQILSQPVSVCQQRMSSYCSSLPSPMNTLPPLERAAFSTAIRLLSCTVTESLTRAIYIPVAPFGVDARALAVILSSDASNKPPSVIAAYKPEDILAILLLKHVPIFKHDTSNPYALEIGLLDPMDITPNIFVVGGRERGIDKACPQAPLVANLPTLVH